MTATRSSAIGQFAEIDRDILILQVGLGKRCLANDIGQLARGVGEQGNRHSTAGKLNSP
jgi:hypothetical protein